jgi:drug/metabolite transporter (DMT)-like permease
VRKHAASTPPNAVAAWSQLFASLQLTPLLLVLPPPPPAGWAGITLQLAAIGLLFGLLCNALAYLFYFRLIRDLGPTRALTVTFLMPAFGVLWAVLLLGESLTPGMASGGAIILLGTWLVLRRG